MCYNYKYRSFLDPVDKEDDLFNSLLCVCFNYLWIILLILQNLFFMYGYMMSWKIKILLLFGLTNMIRSAFYRQI